MTPLAYFALGVVCCAGSIALRALISVQLERWMAQRSFRITGNAVDRYFRKDEGR